MAKHTELEAALKRAYEEERFTRKLLLRLHGAKGVAVGLAMMIGGVPAQWETERTDFRFYLGSLAIVAGFTLFVGAHRRFNRTTMELTGLVLMGIWDILITLSFCVSICAYAGEWVLVWPWDTHTIIPLDQPRIYPVFVYAALATMIWTAHFSAVMRERKHGRIDVTDLYS